ncbi:hypothetical protein MMC26_002569 [Xylographa opegraphella]|nr:hypothetical protein [Xylographa opegraphella]
MVALERHSEYQLVTEKEAEDGSAARDIHQNSRERACYAQCTRISIACLVAGVFTLFLAFRACIASGSSIYSSCDSPTSGYRCQPKVSHYWGQYSPYFSIPSEIPSEVPEGCKVTFVQVLARHGARDPTAAKTVEYKAVIEKIKSHVENYSPEYEFLKDYVYRLGADQLSVFGQQELVNLGSSFYQRYRDLAQAVTPFIRASDQDRVVESAKNFTQGFHQARIADKASSAIDKYPYPIVVVSEEDGSNNTLHHEICTNFENGPSADVGWDAQKQWVELFVPSIRARLNTNMPGAELTAPETIHFMDLCPFETVANRNGKVSRFCSLFTEEEWHQFDYYQSLGKFYGFGNGNPLGPTQGVGFTNELIARLTISPVHDRTSVNHTLDNSDYTFPLDRVIYADFSHDNDLTAIFSALGLYNTTASLSNTSSQTTAETNGYSASWTVPFASRAYFEKLKCKSNAAVDNLTFEEERVRVLVNDRVLPLQSCGADALGRCALSEFVKSLSFARSGGAWDQCFD